MRNTCVNLVLIVKSTSLFSSLPHSRRQFRISIFLLPGGVDNCVKLWNARSICNPDDDDDEGTDPK